jgi:adenylate cyclase
MGSDARQPVRVGGPYRHNRCVATEPADTPVSASLESELLGGARRYTRRDVAERAGVPIEQARSLWRALGFADLDDDNVAFTDRDVEALRGVVRLVEMGLLDDETQLTMTRALGQSLSRLAEWQVGAIAEALGDGRPLSEREAVDAARDLLPVMESLLIYVWRRHLAATAVRSLGSPEGATDSTAVVGFTDLVGFTTLTRHVDEIELAAVVERFERTASDVVAEHGGRVIKTLGDEVMFSADEPGTGAEIAMRLLEAVEQEAELPAVRIGLAYGETLSRLGDLYGEPVNLAARLTSLARPDSVLVDRELATRLEDDPRWRLRRVPPRPVRGYALLQPLRLRRAEPDAP